MSELATNNFAMVFRAYLKQVLYFLKPVFIWQHDSYTLSLIFMEWIRDDR